MKKYWQTLVKVLSLICLVAVLVAACAPGAAPPAEKGKTVKVGLSLCMTGVIATTAERLSVAIRDYLSYVNDELGGIEYTDPTTGKTERVKLDIMWEDNAYAVPRAISIYKRQKAAGAMVMHLTAGSMVEGCLTFITRDHMPVVYAVPVSPLAVAARPIYTTAEEANYADLIGGWMNWVKENWTLDRAPRVGVIGVDSPMCRGVLGRPDLAAYAAKIGVEFLPLEWAAYTVTDTTIEVTRLANKGADWVYINHVSGGIVVVTKDWVRLGLKEKMRLCCVTYGFDESVLKLAPMEGVYGQQSNCAAAEDVPGVRLAKEIAAKYTPGREVGMYYIKGTRLGMVMCEGIRLALEKVGYENLTSEAINEGLHSIRDFDTGGIGPLLTIDPEYPVYCPYTKFYTVEGGKIKPVSDWVECPAVIR